MSRVKCFNLIPKLFKRGEKNKDLFQDPYQDNYVSTFNHSNLSNESHYSQNRVH